MREGDLIRFVTSERHEPYGHRTGIVQAAYELLWEHRPPDFDRLEIRRILDWFNEHMRKPGRLAVSRRPRAGEFGICWMRASSHEHVTQLRRLAALVEKSGMQVEELRTTRPGYVLYEDDHQIVALPFADTAR